MNKKVQGENAVSKKLNSITRVTHTHRQREEEEEEEKGPPTRDTRGEEEEKSEREGERWMHTAQSDFITLTSDISRKERDTDKENVIE